MTDREAEPVEVLRRWEASGAVWEVLAESGEELTVALLTCDAGQEMGRVRSADPALRDYVAGRHRSDEDGPGGEGDGEGNDAEGGDSD